VQLWYLWTVSKYYIFWVSVGNLRYPACKAHVSYCHLWSALLYSIFPHYLTSDTFKKKRLLDINYVYWFSVQVSSKTFLILRRIWQDIIINLHWSSCKVTIFLSNFNESVIFLTDCRKGLKYQISWKSVQWEPSCLIRMNWQTTMKLIVTFHNFVNVSKQ